MEKKYYIAYSFIKDGQPLFGSTSISGDFNYRFTEDNLIFIKKKIEKDIGFKELIIINWKQISTL